MLCSLGQERAQGMALAKSATVALMSGSGVSNAQAWCGRTTTRRKGWGSLTGCAAKFELNLVDLSCD